MDSSGNHLKKCSKTLLNTSFCIPPFESGQSPYSLFDLISSSNKTTDFIVAFQWFYSYLRDITNSEVNFPDICITDMSFAQLHSITEFFNKTKLEEYINETYLFLIGKSDFRPKTILTCCENHLTVNFLKNARKLTSSPIADMLVSSFFQVLLTCVLLYCFYFCIFFGLIYSFIYFFKVYFLSFLVMKFI